MRIGRLVPVLALSMNVATAAPSGATSTGSLELLVGGEETRSFGGNITPDGRFVVFHTTRSLVAADENDHGDVYLLDRVTEELELVSRALDGGAGDGASLFPDVSADGGLVAFSSAAADLVPDGRTPFCYPGGISSSPGPIRRYPCFQVYLLDRETGTIRHLHDTIDEGLAQLPPAISGDGSVVVFETYDAAIGTGESGVFANRKTLTIVDLEAGGISQAHPGPIPLPAGDQVGVPERWVDPLNPDISHDGSSIVFATEAMRSPDQEGTAPPQAVPYEHARVYLYDRAEDRFQVISDPPGGRANGTSFPPPRISADGDRVAFASWASNLVPEDVEDAGDIFLWERDVPGVRRLSVSSSGRGADSGVAWDHQNRMGITISPDGGQVAFTSPSALEGDRPDCALGYEFPCAALFIHDIEARTTELGLRLQDGAEPNGETWDVAMSDGGEHVLFASNAPSLLPGVPEGWGLYILDRGPVLGAGALDMRVEGDELRLEGRTRLPGVTAASADDPDDDGLGSEITRGAELTGGQVLFRSGREDLAVIWSLRDTASTPVNPNNYNTMRGIHDPAPLVVLTFEVELGGRPYRVEGRWPSQDVGEAAEEPTEGMRFELFDCSSATCDSLARVQGALGSTGTEAVVVLPLGLLGASPGDEAESSSLRTEVSGEVVDEVVLDTFAVPSAGGTVALRSADTLEVITQGPIAFANGGDFDANLDVTGRSGEHLLDLELCLGSTCRMETTALNLGA